MEVLRTPEHRFLDLPGYRFAPNYVEVSDLDGGMLRLHYLDEGPPEAAPVLLLHGEPSWSYLYRHMVAPLVAAGHRVVVPDQVGFGRSDKPTEQSDYSYARHVAWMSSLVFAELDLRHITLFGQDWGGLIGLRLVTAEPDRFARVAVANTGLPDGTWPMPDAFNEWQHYARTEPTLPVGDIVNGACTTELSAEVMAAYDAPFPDERYKAGARVWPALVPTTPDDPEVPAIREAWRVLARFDKPFLCCFSDGDPMSAGGDIPFLATVPGTEGQPHTTIEGGGHFLQEDCGPELARVLIEFIAAD